MSPKLFAIYIDLLIRILVTSGLIIVIYGIAVGVIVFADDTTILCTS